MFSHSPSNVLCNYVSNLSPVSYSVHGSRRRRIGRDCLVRITLHSVRLPSLGLPSLVTPYASTKDDRTGEPSGDWPSIVPELVTLI